MMDAYEQIRIELDCVQYTGMSSPYGTFISNVLQQGDCNGPSTFQRVLTWILRDQIGQAVHVWFDDIFTGTTTVKEHNEKFLWIYTRLKDEKLYISPKKFEPFAPVLDILGCKVDSNGIHADSDKLKKIRNWRTPENHTEVLRFLGLIEYLAKFLPNISAYTGPLQTICTSHMPFRWSALHEKCFAQIKAIACKTPILKPIIWDIPDSVSSKDRDKFHVWVITDACPAGVGAVLAQGEEWQTSNPAAFMSKKIHAHPKSVFRLRAGGSWRAGGAHQMA
jgi:hypothetical protein